MLRDKGENTERKLFYVVRVRERKRVRGVTENMMVVVMVEEERGEQGRERVREG